MRIHCYSLLTLFVALLFVSGTVGCQHTGGPWYKTNSYSFWKPTSKKTSQAPPYSSESLANSKPSSESQPNISSIPGGYTVGADRYARTTSPSDYSANPGVNQTTASQQGTPNPYSYGGYTSAADPSSYPPSYAGGQTAVATNAAASNSYDYPGTTSSYGGVTPATHTSYDYPAAGVPVGTPYQQTNVYSTAPQNYAPIDYNSGVNPAASSVMPENYTGGVPQQQPYSDPYGAVNQQQAVPAGYYNQPTSVYGQPQPTSTPHAYGSAPAPASYPSYQQPPSGYSGGYNF